MKLIDKIEKNKKCINRNEIIKLLKDYKKSFNNVNTIQKLLLLNRQFEQDINLIYQMILK